MNARTPIQPPTTPAVLSLSFSLTRNRFIAGLSSGLRVFRTDNCLTTYQPILPTDGGIAIAEAVDDRYIAFVAGGRIPAGSRNVVVFWDCVLGREVTRIDFYEPVGGLRIGRRWMVVILRERVVVVEYQVLKPMQLPSPPAEEDDGSLDEILTAKGSDDTKALLIGPNRVKSIHPTTPNPHAIATLRNDLLVIPAQTSGQLQLVPLSGGSKRVLRAHNTSIRQLALSPRGDLLATASEQGTLIRVFDTKTLDPIGEFRRGVEKAVVWGLAFSEGGRWLAATSDKGTVHIFDLHPSSSSTEKSHPSPTTTAARSPQQTQTSSQHRKTNSNPIHRLSTTTTAPSTHSHPSTSPSTATATTIQTHHGSIAEYYGLRPPPSSASPTTSREAAATAISAFRSSPFAPRIFKDVRSVASAPFYIGDDPPHWQGGVASSWTTAPGGTRRRVKHPVPALPAEPGGRPSKGVVAFAAVEREEGDEGQGATFYVLGGGVGSEARWEMFELVPREEGGWGVVNRGFRRFLGRQFVD